MDIYYDCMTCGQPYGFGRVTFEPAECNRCDPPPPYVPEPSDFELGEQAERERIIKLLEDYAGISEDCLAHFDLCTCTFQGRAIDLIALIKGEK